MPASSRSSSVENVGSTGVIHRLVRTISGNRNGSTTALASAGTKSASTTSLTAMAASPPSTASAVEDPVDLSSQSRGQDAQKKRKSGRFWSFGNFGRSKSQERQDSEAEEVMSSDGETLVASSPNAKGKGKAGAHLRAVTEEPGDLAAEGNPNDTVEEPATLAEKLRSLIDSLPIPSPPGPARTIPVPRKPKPPAKDKTGKPIPPPPPSPISDSRLIALLSSATFMNGSGAKARPSIFSILDNLGASHHHHHHDPAAGEPEEGRPVDDDDEDDDGDYEENTTIMLCSPIIPMKGDLVELADSEVVKFPSPLENDIDPDGDGPQVMYAQEDADEEKNASSEAEGEGKQRAAKPSSGWLWWKSAAAEPAPPPRPPMRKAKKGRARTQTIWRPSTTKLSLEAMWWGYRLWLPPPVMDILSDKSIEAAKRASLITTALSWFFSNLPISSFPLPMQPVLFLLQRLVPYLGYIGTFISWSWSTIKSYDVGHGVYLSATWILPFALIPGTWDANEFPEEGTPTSPPPPNGRALPPPPGVPVPKITEQQPLSPTVDASELPPAPSLPPVPLPDEDDDGPFNDGETLSASASGEGDPNCPSSPPPDEGLPISPIIGSPAMDGKKKPFWAFKFGHKELPPA